MQRYFALLCLFLLPVFVMAFVVPAKPVTYVNDYAKMLSGEEVTALETKLQSFERNTTNEIAVVTITSLDVDTVENVAQDIFTEWGIGKTDKNNGVLLLVAVDDRQARIHTGYGVEGNLPDITTFYIQQEVMIPSFRTGDYYVGIDRAVDKMINALGGMEIVPEGYKGQQKSQRLNFELIFLFGFVIFEILISMLAKSKSWWGGGVVGSILGGGIIWYFGIISILAGIFAFVVPVLLGFLIDYFVSKSYTTARLAGGYPWWMGRGGGGMGGGGFGGFGGGMSGGGGSSSRW